MKFGKEKLEKTLEETFKPIVDPRQKLVDVSTEKKSRYPSPTYKQKSDSTKYATKSPDESNFESYDFDDTLQLHDDDDTSAAASEGEEESFTGGKDFQYFERE